VRYFQNYNRWEKRFGRGFEEGIKGWKLMSFNIDFHGVNSWESGFRLDDFG